MKPTIYAGGVEGIETLMDPSSSREFRFNGGGVYLHGQGWAKFDENQRWRVALAVEHSPVAIEIGFGNGEAHDMAWVQRFTERYLNFRLVPDMILSNCFAKQNEPTIDRWESFVQDFRLIDYKKPIYPILEFANYRRNINVLKENTVSKRTYFQEFIEFSNGIAIDTAAGYFFRRDKDYQNWIIDAIQWSKRRNYPVVLIVSPFDTQSLYQEHTKMLMDFLTKANAMPDTIVIENYKVLGEGAYIPKVGREWMEDTCLGVGHYLLTDYFQQEKAA
jgi:hypothetical protein